MSPESEAKQAELLRRIAAGDRLAMGEFYDETAGSLFSYSFRILGNAQDAEEAIQDVFVQIWTKAATFDVEIALPFHWALSIARNRCIDRLRARQRRSKVMVEKCQDFETGGPHERAVESESQPDSVEDLRAHLDSLPADQKQAIELAFFGGMTHHEIAEMLKEPLGTIKARIRRGLLKLRENLDASV